MRWLTRSIRRGVLCGVFLAGAVLFAAASKEPVKLTLPQAVDLALKNNHALAIDSYKVAEMTSA